MKKLVLFITLGVGMIFILPRPTSAAGITIEVYASSAPNVFGSPNWNTYLANAMSGIENGGVATGTPGTPGYYESGTFFDPCDLIVTSFNSWGCEVNPSAPFDGELGQRLHFGLYAVSNEAFALDWLHYDMDSSDGANALNFDGSFAGLDYSSTRIGINYGGDGMLGGGDDTIINSGSGTQLVHQLVYVGVGNAFWPGSPEEIADTIAYMGPGFSVSTRYWFEREGVILGEGSTTATAAPVPEPTTLVMLGLGLAFAGRRLKRRQ